MTYPEVVTKSKRLCCHHVSNSQSTIAVFLWIQLGDLSSGISVATPILGFRSEQRSAFQVIAIWSARVLYDRVGPCMPVCFPRLSPTRVEAARSTTLPMGPGRTPVDVWPRKIVILDLFRDVAELSGLFSLRGPPPVNPVAVGEDRICRLCILGSAPCRRHETADE